MADQAEGVVVTTAPMTGTFLNLDKPRAVKGPNGKPSGEEKFSGNFEFAPDHQDYAALKARAVAVAKAKWPGRDLKELAFPFTSGDKLADKAEKKGKNRDFSRGKVVLTARTKYPPNLSVVENGRLVDVEDDARAAACKKYFYTGVQTLAEFNFVAYDGVGANPDGVTAYLNKVCSLNKGKKLISGGGSGVDTFKSYIGLASNEDPTEGLDDEIPF